VLWQQNPRNRRIAEVLGKCGLVERAGQGFDLIFRECISSRQAATRFSPYGSPYRLVDSAR
jgi:ATP-dependent DNA helicase RecG